METPKFKIGDKVSHRPDLYGMTVSTIVKIQRGFWDGENTQWMEDDAGRLSTPSYIDEDTNEFVFEAHEEKVFNKTWNQEEQKFESSVGGTKFIPEHRIPFYGYTLQVKNDKMGSIIPEKYVTLLPPPSGGTLSRIKVGEDYYQIGYGRGLRKGVVIWHIEGKLYAKDRDNWRTDMYPLRGRLDGYVRISAIKGEPHMFHQVSGSTHLDTHDDVSPEFLQELVQDWEEKSKRNSN